MAQTAAEARPPLRVIVAANVRFERLAQGMSQEKVARLAELSGDTIRVIENARDPERSGNALRLDTLERIAKALSMEPAELLRWNENTTRAYLHAIELVSPALAVVEFAGGPPPHRKVSGQIQPPLVNVVQDQQP